MKKKTTPAPSIADRLTTATEDLADALSVFEDVATRLGQVALQHDRIAEEAAQEIARLQSVKSAAQAQATRAGAAQVKVRDLIG